MANSDRPTPGDCRDDMLKAGSGWHATTGTGRKDNEQ